MKQWTYRLLVTGAMAAVVFEINLNAQEFAGARRAGGLGAEQGTGIALDQSPQPNVHLTGYFVDPSVWART